MCVWYCTITQMIPIQHPPTSHPKVSDLLLRHSLICFLWRLVSLDSCIITEHQETEWWAKHKPTHTINYFISPFMPNHPHQNSNESIISHLSMSWVSLLYRVALGLFHSPPPTLPCEEASICNLRDTQQTLITTPGASFNAIPVTLEATSPVWMCERICKGSRDDVFNDK